MFINRILRRTTAVTKTTRHFWKIQNKVNRRFVFNNTSYDNDVKSTWTHIQSFHTTKFNQKDNFTPNDDKFNITPIQKAVKEEEEKKNGFTERETVRQNPEKERLAEKISKRDLPDLLQNVDTFINISVEFLPEAMGSGLQQVEALTEAAIETFDETIPLEVQAKAEPEQFEALASSLAELALSPIYDKMCKKYGLTRKEYDDAELFYYYSSKLTSDEKAAMRRYDVLEQAFMLNTSGRIISEMNSKILKLQMSGLEKQQEELLKLLSDILKDREESVGIFHKFLNNIEEQNAKVFKSQTFTSITTIGFVVFCLYRILYIYT